MPTMVSSATTSSIFVYRPIPRCSYCGKLNNELVDNTTNSTSRQVGSNEDQIKGSNAADNTTPEPNEGANNVTNVTHGQDGNGSNGNEETRVKLKLCTGCRRSHYCNATCQKSDRSRHKSVCSPRKIRVPGEDANVGSGGSGFSFTQQVQSQCQAEDDEHNLLKELAQTIIETKIRPEILRQDVAPLLAAFLRQMLLGPAQPLNKEKNFEEDILKDGDLMADCEIYVESLEGCHESLIRRNRGEEVKRRMYPDPKDELRISEEVLRYRCETIVRSFAEKKHVTDEASIGKAVDMLLFLIRGRLMHETAPKVFNSYTGMTALMADVPFLRQSEDMVLFGLGILKELPPISKYNYIYASSPSSKHTSPLTIDSNPPWHTLLVYGLAMSACVYNLPSLSSIDEYATIQTFTSSIFPPESFFHLSPLALGIIRISFAIFAIIVTKAKIDNGVDLKLVYLPGSKLTQRNLVLKGWKTQGFYTSWAWNLLGFSFFLSGLIPLLIVAEREDVLHAYPWIVRSALLSFEIAAPSAIFTSTIVTYALWPQSFKTYGSAGTEGYKFWVNQCQHNWNTGMVLVELCLMGGIPVKMGHMALAPLFAGMYQMFLWGMKCRWSEGEEPVFLYFFMDTTLGWKTTVFMIGLLLVMLLFFALFALLEMFVDVIEHSGLGGGVPNLGCVLVISYFLMKFND